MRPSLSAIGVMTLPPGGPDSSEKRSVAPSVVLGEIIDGWKYIYSNPPVRRIVLAKGLWASGGGAQVFLLILIGMEAGFGEVLLV